MSIYTDAMGANPDNNPDNVMRFLYLYNIKPCPGLVSISCSVCEGVVEIGEGKGKNGPMPGQSTLLYMKE